MYTTKVINTSNSLRITACILLSHSSLITDKLANGIYASLPFYGSWENHFSKVNRRGGENSKWSFKGAHYTDFDSITYKLFPGFRKMVRWRLCYFFPSSDEQLSISDTLNDFLKPKNLSCKTLVRRRLFLIGKKVSKFKATTCRVD